ncbi:large subunit ribosomal protein L4 [Desulfitispora alkaliphila]|uniref:50S ribosomal protein L4 n=1 Tax=Desulfitispora alkaliphila TaxID=622674 RepID=UPI003D1EBDA3
MPKVAMYNTEGGQVGEIDLKEEVFGIEVNETVMHKAVVQYLASLRRGTASVKSRGEVRGGGRKPFRQKGTGRARAGTTRSPIWRGGSIVFGPQPRSYSFRLPKKMRRLALKSALSTKVEAGEIVVVEELAFSEPKTKEMVKVLKALNANKALVVTADKNENVVKSARNIEGVKPLEATGINVYDILNHDKLVITKDAVAKVEEVLA